MTIRITREEDNDYVEAKISDYATYDEIVDVFKRLTVAYGYNSYLLNSEDED